MGKFEGEAGREMYEKLIVEISDILGVVADTLIPGINYGKKLWGNDNEHVERLNRLFAPLGMKKLKFRSFSDRVFSYDKKNKSFVLMNMESKVKGEVPVIGKIYRDRYIVGKLSQEGLNVMFRELVVTVKDIPVDEAGEATADRN